VDHTVVEESEELGLASPENLFIAQQQRSYSSLQSAVPASGPLVQSRVTGATRVFPAQNFSSAEGHADRLESELLKSNISLKHLFCCIYYMLTGESEHRFG
jgi:hypothetical protein